MIIYHIKLKRWKSPFSCKLYIIIIYEYKYSKEILMILLYRCCIRLCLQYSVELIDSLTWYTYFVHLTTLFLNTSRSASVIWDIDLWQRLFLKFNRLLWPMIRTYVWLSFRQLSTAGAVLLNHICIIVILAVLCI